MSPPEAPPFLTALPAYLGGKRRLLPAIFAAVEEAVPRRGWPGLTFLDPFSGGGAVSLYAKGQGFSVHTNDIAARGYVVGKALIENSEAHLAKLDLLPLFEGAVDAELLEIALEFLSERQARFAARAIPAARAAPGAKRWLLLLAIIKWLLRALPMSSPAATDAARAAALDLDSISPKRVGSFRRGQASVGPDALWRVARQVNAGVLPGTGRASQLDARDFLQRYDGDIVYVDPPYPGTMSYEHEYRRLDRLLEGQQRDRSEFSGRAPPLDDLLDAIVHVPVWVISFGGRGPEELIERVRARRKRVGVHRIQYQHLAALAPERWIDEFVVWAVS